MKKTLLSLLFLSLVSYANSETLVLVETGEGSYSHKVVAAGKAARKATFFNDMGMISDLCILGAPQDLIDRNVFNVGEHGIEELSTFENSLTISFDYLETNNKKRMTIEQCADDITYEGQ